MADITAGSVKSKKKKKISIFPIVNWNLPLTKKVYLEELYNGFAKK